MPVTMWTAAAGEAVPKSRRMQLAKSELLVLLAVKTSEWEKDVTDAPGCGTIPFADWPDDDPFRDLARRYNLTGADLGRLLHRLGDELERRAERAGYEDAWINAEDEP